MNSYCAELPSTLFRSALHFSNPTHSCIIGMNTIPDVEQAPVTSTLVPVRLLLPALTLFIVFVAIVAVLQAVRKNWRQTVLFVKVLSSLRAISDEKKVRPVRSNPYSVAWPDRRLMSCLAKRRCGVSGMAGGKRCLLSASSQFAHGSLETLVEGSSLLVTPTLKSMFHSLMYHPLSTA